MLNFLLGSKIQLAMIGVLVAVIGYFAWDYSHSKSELTKARAEAAAAVEAAKTLRKDFDTYKQTQDDINDILSNQRSTVERQTTVKESVRNVPTKNTKPFASDPGMLERARRLRDYQQSSPVN